MKTLHNLLILLILLISNTSYGQGYLYQDPDDDFLIALFLNEEDEDHVCAFFLSDNNQQVLCTKNQEVLIVGIQSDNRETIGIFNPEGEQIFEFRKSTLKGVGFWDLYNFENNLLGTALLQVLTDGEITTMFSNYEFEETQPHKKYTYVYTDPDIERTDFLAVSSIMASLIYNHIVTSNQQ